jgi:hypothetical protein
VEKDAKSKVELMNYYSAVLDGITYGLLLACILAFLNIFSKKMMRTFPEFILFKYPRMFLIKSKALKVEEFGYKVYMYISWVDGKQIRVQDMEKENEITIKDPIIFEQHRARNLPFNVDVNCIAYRKSDLSVYGNFFRINSDSGELRKGKIIKKEKGD